jgi:hypothetical protein
VVRDGHLFLLQIHISSFETGWQGEMTQRKEAFHGLGSRMLQSSILIDALSSACWENNKERNGHRSFFPGLNIPCWLCHAGFLQLLGAIRG